MRFYRRFVPDDLSDRYGDLLSGSYDCADRIVLNAYFSIGHSPGGFRMWWRRLHGESDDDLDNAHLMRMAGRFSRRLRAWAGTNGIPVVDCKAGERKHLIAEVYLDTHAPGLGVFLVLVARAPATTWDVQRRPGGPIRNLTKKKAFVNHYSFHIIDSHHRSRLRPRDDQDVRSSALRRPGHLERPRAPRRTSCCGRHRVQEGGKLLHGDLRSRRPGRGARDLVAPRGCRAPRPGLRPVDLYRLSVLRARPRRPGASGFSYSYSVYQVEYSRNLLFCSGAEMEAVFDAVVDRTRSRLDVKTLRTLFGTKQRPRNKRRDLSPRVAAVIEAPQYGLTIFKVHFGALTLKGYTKGEHVLRFEAVCHNMSALKIGRVLDRFPGIVTRLQEMLERFCTALDCVDVAFIPDGVLDELGTAAQLGATPVGGLDLNKAARTRSSERSVRSRPHLTASRSLISPSTSTASVATRATPRDRPPTTCASCAPTTSSRSRALATAINFCPTLPKPSRPCSFFATR